MKLSIPESKLNSKGWIGREARSGWERKRENWMGKYLGERGLNKKAASWIFGLDIKIYAQMDCESIVVYRLKWQCQKNISSLSFLTSEPMVTHLSLYTPIIITTIIQDFYHVGWIYGAIIYDYIKWHCIKMHLCSIGTILQCRSHITTLVTNTMPLFTWLMNWNQIDMILERKKEIEVLSIDEHILTLLHTRFWSL